MKTVAFLYENDSELLAIAEIRGVTETLTLVQVHKEDGDVYVPPMSVRVWGIPAIQTLRDVCDRMLKEAASRGNEKTAD